MLVYSQGDTGKTGPKGNKGESGKPVSVESKYSMEQKCFIVICCTYQFNKEYIGLSINWTYFLLLGHLNEGCFLLNESLQRSFTG